MAQVTYLGHGGRFATQNGNFTPTFTGLSLLAGDLVVVIGSIAANARTVTAPAGWSATTYARDSTATNGPSLFFAWKAWASGDADPLMTVGGTSTPGAGIVATIYAWRNADTTTGPTFGTVFSSGSTTTSNVGPVTGVAVTGLGLGLVVGGWQSDLGSGNSSATGYTFDNDDEHTTATLKISYFILEKAVSSATTSSVTVTGNPTAAATAAGVQVAIHEAAAAPSFSGTVALSGSGTLRLTAVGSVALSGSGTLTALGTAVGAKGTLATSGTGTVTFSTVTVFAGRAALSGSSRLQIFGSGRNADAVGSVTLSGSGALALNSGIGVDPLGTAPFGGHFNTGKLWYGNGTTWVDRTSFVFQWDGSTWTAIPVIFY